MRTGGVKKNLPYGELGKTALYRRIHKTCGSLYDLFCSL